MRLIKKSLQFTEETVEYIEQWENSMIHSFYALSERIGELCQRKKIVLMIDEVDKISNHHLSINFLGMLRDKYLKREAGLDTTFHSVILAGIYDVKNIKLSFIQKGLYQAQEGERSFNSPWNIAATFEVDMSFSPEEIATMLAAYEQDHHSGMSIPGISEEIYTYTNGYPFLVSKICKCIDESLAKNWTREGVQAANQSHTQGTQYAL